MDIRKKIIENEKIVIRIALIMIFVWGVLMTFLIPSWQIPDEYTHLNIIGQSWKSDSLAETLLQDMDLDCFRIMGQADEKISVDEWKSAMSKSPDYSREDCLPGGIELSVLKHLPASIGIWFGILLRVPTFWVLELGELFALAFAVFVFSVAIRLMPVKKEIMLMIMAFPMTIQQISSINYDSVLLPLCFLFVAYIFYLRIEKETLGWKEVIITLVLTGLITYIKLPYVFLVLLVLILPKEKICLKIGKLKINGNTIRKWRIPVGIIIILLLCAGIYVGRHNQWLQIVIAMVCEWRRSIYLVRATIQTWGKYLLVSSVGQFGWLEIGLPFVFVAVTYLVLLVLAVWGKETEQEYRLKCRGRIILWVLFVIMCGFTMMSMVNHTIMLTLFGAENAPETYNARQALYQIPYIGGLQGRYFLPFLSLPFLALPGMGKKVKGKMWIVIGYIFVAAILTILVLCRRYWIG